MGTALTSLTTKLAKTLGMEDGSNLVDTLKNTAFRSDNPVTDAQMTALLVVANQYGLNPWTKEIYAFPDKKNGIVPVVGVDGWSRIINDHSAFDGMDFRQSETMVRMPGAKVDAPEWMECIIYRKDRSHPIVVREYLDEVYRPPFEGNGRNGPYKIEGPWQTHTKRFLRHKTMIQASRITFGYSGIYDQDEAERIIEGTAREVEAQPAIQSPKRTSKKADAPALEQQANGVPLNDAIEDAEYSPVERQQEETPRQQQRTAEQPQRTEDSSAGMLTYIRNKAKEKGLSDDDILRHFKLEVLEGIDRDTGVAIVNWIKSI